MDPVESRHRMPGPGLLSRHTSAHSRPFPSAGVGDILLLRSGCRADPEGVAPRMKASSTERSFMADLGPAGFSPTKEATSFFIILIITSFI